MNITDRVYGEFQIDDVLCELIESKPVQRLKGIHQGGASYLVNQKWDMTRYEHSVGVMLLIKKLGGSLQEQIAGLLHDVSHTAFSHVIDFVVDSPAEDYHEHIFQQVVEDSEIPTILSTHGFDYQSILFNIDKWTILEQPAPALCADRIDYTLRDLLYYEVISKKEAGTFLESLVIAEGQICTHSIEMAEWFVNAYYKEVIDFFMDPLNVYANDRLAGVLKVSLAKEIILLSDLLKDDQCENYSKHSQLSYCNALTISFSIFSGFV